MVGHQAIGVKVEREPGPLIGELEKEPAVIVIRFEDELAIIASGDDVVEPALDFESRLSHTR